MNIYFRSIVCLIITVALMKGAQAQENRQHEIDSLMQRAFRIGLFNGNILVADQGRVVYGSSLGYANAGKTTLLTDRYRFHIGSIAKEFNAVAILMLKEEGKLELDDKISRVLPDLPLWADRISVRDLLQYTSGLPDVKWDQIKSDADNLYNLKHTQQLDFEPGSNYAYNNNNVFLQRRIIERLSGVPFKRFVEDSILKPCGMQASLVDPSERDTMIARAFNNEGEQDPLVYPISGWTSVTINDFYQWSQCLNGFRLIKPASTKAILIPVRPHQQAGLGNGSMEGDRLITHEHDGTSRNYQALLTVDQSKGRTVILMTNNKNNKLYDINRAIQYILDGKPYQMPKRSIYPLFERQLDTLAGAGVIARYEALKAASAAEYAFDDESELNTIGYWLLGKQRLDDAIVVFEYNTRLFPSSGNVFDSLGEAWYKKGDKEKALANYKRSLQLDPSNTTAQQVIRELERK